MSNPPTSRPLISVVVPVYNRVGTLSRTLECIFRQSFSDYEVVAVDDGSTDGSHDELLRWARAHEQLRVVTKVNGGVSSARNLGAKEATGTWIALCDADDLWLPDYLSELNRIIASFPASVMVGTDYYTQWGERLRWHRQGGRIRSIDFFAEYGPLKVPFHTSSVAIRRDVFLQVGGFDAAHTFFEDAELFFKVAGQGPVSVSDRVLAVYTDDGANKITKNTRQENIVLPHVDYLERLANAGNLSRSQHKCARKWMLRELKSTVGDGRKIGVREMYPMLFASLPWYYKFSMLAPISLFARRVLDGVWVRLMWSMKPIGCMPKEVQIAFKMP